MASSGIFGDFRSVDESTWEHFTARMVDDATRQLAAARVDYALAVELGGRVMYAMECDSPALVFGY